MKPRSPHGVGRAACVAAALWPACLAACGPPLPPPRAASPAERHRDLLVRSGALFVQVRIDRARELLPSLGDAVRLASASSSPGGGCLADLAWSADLASATIATAGGPGSATTGGVLAEGGGVPDDRLGAWVDCFLAGLGSGRVERRVPVPGPAGDPGAPRASPAAQECMDSVLFVTGTGRASALAVGSASADRYALVLEEPLENWIRPIACAAADGPLEPAAASFVDRVGDADVWAVWLDPAGVAGALDAASAGLAPVPPPEEIGGAAVGLWLGDGPRATAVVEARGPAAASAVAESIRTVLTVLGLSASVLAAQLGHDYGPDVGVRVEQAAEILRRVEVDASGAVAFARVDLSGADLDLLEGVLLVLASRMLETP